MKLWLKASHSFFCAMDICLSCFYSINTRSSSRASSSYGTGCSTSTGSTKTSVFSAVVDWTVVYATSPIKAVMMPKTVRTAMEIKVTPTTFQIILLLLFLSARIRFSCSSFSATRSVPLDTSTASPSSVLTGTSKISAILIKSQVPEPMIKGFVAVFVYYPYTTAQTSYKRSTALRSSSTSGCV